MSYSKLILILIGIISLLPSHLAAAKSERYPLGREDIYVRDPFILADKTSQTYYLYAAREYPKGDGSFTVGVGVHTSKDLENWSSNYPVFQVEADSWGKDDVWAPEVHKYQGKYYLFVTLMTTQEAKRMQDKSLTKRGTQIFVADTPIGPFKKLAPGPTTPEDWLALDGSLWVEDNQAWMVFCHEWAQITDGTMEAVKMSKDLSRMISKPQTLFRATEAPWVVSLASLAPKGKTRPHGYITDGPWLHKTKSGELIMIWSSFSKNKYTIGIARSESGKVTGPWKQDPEPLLDYNGGHGMIFEDFSGQLRLALHYPNNHSTARAYYIPIEDSGNTLSLKQAFQPK